MSYNGRVVVIDVERERDRQRRLSLALRVQPVLHYVPRQQQFGLVRRLVVTGEKAAHVDRRYSLRLLLVHRHCRHRRYPLTERTMMARDEENPAVPRVRTGKFSFTCANHLILQISEKMSRGQPLNSLRLEELKIVRLICVLLFHRGLETLLLRETMNNLGVSDHAVLSRKTPQPYWPHLYRELRQAFPGLDFEAAVFDETRAARLSQRLCHPRLSGGLLTRFVQRHTGLPVVFPEDLARNGNILFSLGTLYGHRLFRLAAFFTRHWGAEAYEPLIRIICQKMWYFYLIGTGKMRITPDAFEIQRSRHETGIFTFIMEDYRTFAGTLSRHPHRPHPQQQQHHHPGPPHPPLSHPASSCLSPEAVLAARALHMPTLANDA